MPLVTLPRLRRNLFQRARAIADTNKAPTEFLIFGPGDNPGDDGAAIFDDTAARACMSTYKQRGVARLVIDYDHKSIDSKAPPSEKIAAGWFTPVVRTGPNGPALWATNVNWTDAAKSGIEKKEWVYISPVFAKDDESRVVSIVNLAITNNPATWGARPLVAASLGGLTNVDPKIVMLYACLMAVAAGGDPTFAPLASEALDKFKAALGDQAGAVEGEAQAALAPEAPAAPATVNDAARAAACGPDATPRAADPPPAPADDTTRAADMPTATDEEKRAARGLNVDAALVLFRSQAQAPTQAPSKRAATIAAAEKDGILPKGGILAVWARSCAETDLDAYVAGAKASGVTVRRAAAAPVIAKDPTAGTPGTVNTTVDKNIVRSAVAQSGVSADRLQKRIVENRQKAEKAEK